MLIERFGKRKIKNISLHNLKNRLKITPVKKIIYSCEKFKVILNLKRTHKRLE